jgi:ribosomal protein S18 acetylase RimI-like enzyme
LLPSLGEFMSNSPVAEFQIRTYRPGEEAKMADLVNRCRAFDFDGPVTVDMIRDEWSDPRLKLDRDTFVAINNEGEYVAVAEVWFNDPDNDDEVITRHIGFAMDPAYRDNHPDLVDHLLEQAMYHAQNHPFRRPTSTYVLRAWASANDPWKQSKIVGLGFHLSHIGYTMVREGLETLPPLPEIPNVRIEAWTEERDPDVMDALNDSFNSDKSFTKLKWEEWQDLYHGRHSTPSLWRLAIDLTNDRIIGLALTEIDEDTNADTGRKDGWIVDLAVRDEWRNYGIGRAVLLAAMHALNEVGITSVLMGVDSNDPDKATQLYESLGFRVMKGSRTYLKPLN